MKLSERQRVRLDELGEGRDDWSGIAGFDVVDRVGERGNIGGTTDAME